MSDGYEVTVSFTALCPCCGKDLPSSSYLTQSRPSDGPFDRDMPHQRKDRRVFITPCADCFEWKRPDVPSGNRVRPVHGGYPTTTATGSAESPLPDGAVKQDHRGRWYDKNDQMLEGGEA